MNMAKKNMIIAMVISFFFAGLGLLYTKEYVKGLIIFVIAVILNILSMFVSPYVAIISFIVWIYGLYATYQSVKAWNANEE